MWPILRITFVLLLHGLPVAASDVSPTVRDEKNLRFEGYLRRLQGSTFAVSLTEHSGHVIARGWLKLGQSFAGYKIESFDEHRELLSVRDSSGKQVSLSLPHAVVRDASGANSKTAVPDPKENSYSRALASVNDFLTRLRNDDRGSLEFKVDAEGDTMPPAVQAKFVEAREREERSNGYLVGIFVNDRWEFSRFSADAGNAAIRESVTTEQRLKIEVAWALAFAEAGVRTLAQRRFESVGREANVRK